MQEGPLVSIIIPAYNRAHLIEKTLDSVKFQVYENWECIVVDDGSTDTTETSVKAYVEIDSRFKFYKRPESHLSGGNGARNYGAEQSNGQYLIFLDSDDLLVETTVLKRMTYCKNAANDLLISTTGTFKRNIGDSDVIWNKLDKGASHPDLIHRFINMDMPWHTNGVTWSRDFFNKTGGWNEDLRAWQDWEMHCRVLFYTPLICVINGQPDNYFRHSRHDSIGKTVRSMQYMESMQNAFISIDGFLAKNTDIFELVKASYVKLLCKMLIHFPVKKGFIFFPLKVLINPYFYKGLNRLFFLKFYIVECLAKSSKIKKLVLEKTYIKQQQFIILESNYLKYKTSDL